VRTAGLTGEVPSSPTSPRVKPPSGAFSNNSSNSPLLKAALNANLARINAQQQQQVASANGAKIPAGQVGSGSSLSCGMLSASGAFAGGYASGQPGISSNVKQRLKEYFVARNTELIPTGAAGGLGAGQAASDSGYSQGLSPMQH
jgi:hypothetical protein